MAELITIARPYARAVFGSAQSGGNGAAGHGGSGAARTAWSEFLARAAALVHDARIEALIGNPRVAAADLVELLLELATAGPPVAAAPAAAPQLLQEQRNFLALLAHNGRLPLLPQIAAQYELLRAQAENVADVQVRSARELTAEQAAKLRAALERRLGRAVRLHSSVDAGLLGGAVVNYDDYVFDGSLRRRIERMAATLGA